MTAGRHWGVLAAELVQMDEGWARAKFAAWKAETRAASASCTRVRTLLGEAFGAWRTASPCVALAAWSCPYISSAARLRWDGDRPRGTYLSEG